MMCRVTKEYGLLGPVLLCVNVILPAGSDPVFILVVGGPACSKFWLVFPSESKVQGYASLVYKYEAMLIYSRHGGKAMHVLKLSAILHSHLVWSGL
jgi:hypothetical protein